MALIPECLIVFFNLIVDLIVSCKGTEILYKTLVGAVLPHRLESVYPAGYRAYVCALLN